MLLFFFFFKRANSIVNYKDILRNLEGNQWCAEVETLEGGLHSWSVYLYIVGRDQVKKQLPYPLIWELTHWKRPWCWEGLGAGGEGDDRGWDAWMASPTRWTWVWMNSGSWWWTGRPGVLGHGVAESDMTERVNLTELNTVKKLN